jgi:hypothetical protein
LHVLAALADEADGVGKTQATGGHKSGIFAEAMARHVVGLPAALIEDAERGNGNREQSRLGILGQAQRFVGSFEANPRQSEAERVVGFFSVERRVTGLILGVTTCVRVARYPTKGAFGDMTICQLRDRIRTTASVDGVSLEKSGRDLQVSANAERANAEGSDIGYI